MNITVGNIGKNLKAKKENDVFVIKTILRDFIVI